MLECKQSEKYLAGDSCTLGEMKELSTDNLCTWDKSDRIAYDGDAYLGQEKFVEF